MLDGLSGSFGSWVHAVCMYVCMYVCMWRERKKLPVGNGGRLLMKFCRSADKSYAVGSLPWRWALPSSLDLLKFGA